MSCKVVVGAQWGDEGKGKIVDALSAEADLVARYQGGPNAGHSVIHRGETLVLHLVPSGILNAGRRCLIGNGVVVDLDKLKIEVDQLEARGIPAREQLGISGSATSSCRITAWSRRRASAVPAPSAPRGAASATLTVTRPRARGCE